MKYFHTFESFNNSSVDEGLFSFLKGLFKNPMQKRKLDKLAERLTQTRIEIGKLKLEGDPIEDFESELEDRSNSYTPSRSFRSNDDNPYQNKIEILEKLEEELVDMMDEIGRENETLEKYVSKVKLESRLQSTEKLMRLADDAVVRVLAKMKKKDMQNIRQADKELYAMRESLMAEAKAKPGPDPYETGLSDDEKEAKKKQIKKQSAMADDDSDAYKEMPGDKEAREEGQVKTSKHVKKYHELFGDDEKNESVVLERAEGDRSPIDNEDIEKALAKKAEETGVSIELIRIVMRRGMAAWKTGHRPGAGQEQWGYARVNSFLTKSKGTWGGADKDVAAEVGDIKESFITEAEETYNDYPAAAKANAKKAIEWKEKYGRDEVTGGTEVGWARAHQLAKGESLSRDVVSRMAQFNRHRKNADVATEYKDEPWKDRGHVAWLIWGGTEGVDWAMKKMDQIKAEESNESMKYFKSFDSFLNESKSN